MRMTFSSLKILVLSAGIIAALVVKADAQTQLGHPTFVPNESVAGVMIAHRS